LGNYSYLGQCLSWCPQYYKPDDNIRACVLSGGYPLNMSVEVVGPQMLRFTIPLPMGLGADPTMLNNLKTNWSSIITLTYI
jgi:hypothetical protein